MHFPVPPPLKPKPEAPACRLHPDPARDRFYKQTIFFAQVFWMAVWLLIGFGLVVAVWSFWHGVLDHRYALTAFLLVFALFGTRFGRLVGMRFIRTGVADAKLASIPKK